MEEKRSTKCLFHGRANEVYVQVSSFAVVDGHEYREGRMEV